MAYTKGEWKRLDLPIGEYSDTFYAIGIDMTHAIATVNRKSFPVEADDNANLIFAAPDMYQALKAIEQVWGKPNWMNDAMQVIVPGTDIKKQICLADLIQKALKKVEGK